MKRIYVTVTETDAYHGNRNRPLTCPVALALKRKFHWDGTPQAIETLTSYSRVNEVLWFHSAALRSAIESYDLGDSFPVGRYRLEYDQ